MPKLSKFRVVNLVYNDTRHIYDEVFDFNEGDHAMMLLANGGGKTVLTQMMLQPVIPKTDLKTRKFADYFKNNSKPTLLMTEWTLDSEAGKLLTGLVIKNTIRKKRGQDEDRELLNIYAFVIHYHYHDTYNIDTIPVISRDAHGHKIMRSYEEILSELQKHEHEHKAYVSLFNWSDSSEAKRLYKEKLAEYGIVQQEWADNILKINKEEAGLKSFFDDAKTSSTLLKRKIFPSIESKLEENNQQRIEIQSLVKSHAMELVKNDQIIQDEKLYNSFLVDCDVYENKVMALASIEADLKESYENLSQIHTGLQKFGQHILKRMSIIEQEKRDNRSMANHIKFEEACYKYYKKEDDYKKVLADIKELEKSIEGLKDKLAITQNLKNQQEAIRIYGNVKSLKAKILLKEASLAQALSKEEDVDIELLMSVLYQKYQSEKITLQERIKRTEGLVASKTDEIEAYVKDHKKLESTIRDDEAGQTRKQYVIKQYEEKISNLNVTNDAFKWEKHPLLQTFEMEDLTSYMMDLRREHNRLKSKEEHTTRSIKDNEISIEESYAKISSAKIEVTSAEHRYEATKKDLEKYLRAHETISREIITYGIQKEKIFDVESVIDDLNGLIDERKMAISQYTVDRSMIVQMGESLKAGRLYTLPEEVLNFLDTNGIAFEYGYQWLRSYQGEKIPDTLYMKYLRALPYALIMSQKDLDRFRALDKSYKLSSIIPIISQNYIKDMFESKALAEADGGLLYHTAFDALLLEQSHLKEKIKNIEDRIREIDHKEKQVNENIAKLQSILYRYEDFIKTYDLDSYERLVQLRDEEEVGLKKWYEEIQLSEAALTKFQEELNQLKNLKLECERALLELGSIIKIYKELAEAFPTYELNVEELGQIEKTLTSNRKVLEELKTTIDDEKQKAQLTKKLIESHKAEMSDLESKMSSMGSSMTSIDHVNPDHPYFIESQEMLEAKVDVYSRNHGDAANIQELLKTYHKNLKIEENKLLELDIDKGIYMEGVFDNEVFVMASNTWNQQTKDLSSLNKNHSIKEALAADKESQLLSMKEDILPANGPDDLLPRTAISDDNFSERKKNNQRLYNEMDASLKSLESLNNLVLSSAKRLEDAMDQKDFLPCEPIIFDLETSAVEIDQTISKSIKTLKMVANEHQTLHGQINSDYNQLLNRYEKKNELLGNMFMNLLKGDNIYNAAYVSRVFRQTRESIRRTKEKYATDLKNIKKSEETLYDFTLSKVSSVYDQLRDIDKYSSIELQDKYQKMLYISLPKKETLEGSKLNQYLKEVIRVTKHRILEGELAELDRYLDNHLKLEQLFDEYIPIHSIGISVAKIEQNKVSKISWEEVSKTSGGEVFVSVFILFISLLSYTRGYQLSRKQQGKVLVMDNPFGPVSSGHLLEPLFKIAATYDTQLICFTHINTSAITSQFDLIYSLRVVRELGSTKEHLDVKLAKNASGGVEVIESNLFEISDGDQLGFL